MSPSLLQSNYNKRIDAFAALLRSSIAELELEMSSGSPGTDTKVATFAAGAAVGAGATLAASSDDRADAVDALGLVEFICQRFHVVARQLRSRHDGRPTIEIGDEYDAQDLLHGILRLHFDDIRPEEWAPSYAGSSSRMDFLLKEEEIVVEVKMARPGSDKKTGEELIIDADCPSTVDLKSNGEMPSLSMRGITLMESQSRQLQMRSVFLGPTLLIFAGGDAARIHGIGKL